MTEAMGVASVMRDSAASHAAVRDFSRMNMK